MNEITLNPFEAGRGVAEMSGARAQAARESTEVLALLYGARQNPRDPIKACDRIRNAFARLGLAEESQYSYSRGGTDITGPSIRAAEAIRLDWGNMATGWRIVSRSVDPDGVGVSEVEAFAVDFETTNREAITFPVRHWRDTRAGGYAVKDERDVYEICANQAQRRKRACILALIPSDVTAMAMEQATTTLRAKADTSPAAMAKMLEAFAPYGVTREHIEANIQRRIDAITPAQVVHLKRIFASLRDGMSEPSQWFAMSPVDAEAGAGQGKTSAAEAITRRAYRRKQAPPPAAAPPAAAMPTPGPPIVRYLAAIESAPDAEAAALILDQSRDTLSEDEQRTLGEAYSAKWQAPA